jgi:hypothetical protein
VHRSCRGRPALTGSTLVIKTHAFGVEGITMGWSVEQLTERLPDFALIECHDASLLGIRDRTPAPSRLMVFHRR